MLSSFRKWLQTEAPTAGPTDFTYSFLSDVSRGDVYPQVGMNEMQFFDPGNSAFGMNIFPKSQYPVSSPAKNGTLSAALAEITIKTDGGADRAALQKAYKIRDRIRAAIVRAGVADDETGVVLVNACEVLDFDNAEARTGIIVQFPVERETSIQEFYVAPDETTPNIHTLRLLVRLEWFELN